jgi:4-amino-4-deoxy-L-arabinose transferase-like glycosyltransferase
MPGDLISFGLIWGQILVLGGISFFIIGKSNPDKPEPTRLRKVKPQLILLKNFTTKAFRSVQKIFIYVWRHLL